MLDYVDYINIINIELEKYTLINSNNKLIEKDMKDKKRIAEEMIIQLYDLGLIKEDMLFHVTGWKNNKAGNMRKITGPQAKFFTNLNPGYIYPLFKTHKLQEK